MLSRNISLCKNHRCHLRLCSSKEIGHLVATSGHLESLLKTFCVWIYITSVKDFFDDLCVVVQFFSMNVKLDISFSNSGTDSF